MKKSKFLILISPLFFDICSFLIKRTVGLEWNVRWAFIRMFMFSTESLFTHVCQISIKKIWGLHIELHVTNWISVCILIGTLFCFISFFHCIATTFVDSFLIHVDHLNYTHSFVLVIQSFYYCLLKSLVKFKSLVFSNIWEH